MATKDETRVYGEAELVERLDGFQNSEAFVRALRELTAELQREMMRNAPRDTGLLESSIVVVEEITEAPKGDSAGGTSGESEAGAEGNADGG